MNPRLRENLLGTQVSSTHHHQTDSCIIANRGVEACESTNIWLRFRFVKKRVALRSDLLPELLFGILIQTLPGDFLEQQTENLRVHTLIIEFRSGLRIRRLHGSDEILKCRFAANDRR